MSQGSAREKLSEKEKEELQAAGKCFICKEAGHMSRNCPKGSTVRSDKRGKPPGITSYNMEPTFNDAEDLRVLAESSAHISDTDSSSETELEVNMLEVGDVFEDDLDGSMPPLQEVSDSSESDTESDYSPSIRLRLFRHRVI
ncbi:hypothetical protein K474DRAFT_1669982 [Panus rudis PR-1116 ss-1]|nr:hypothetical protein K474DRAFT_1669982 [Panus rudis PR-1116 ss-1]